VLRNRDGRKLFRAASQTASEQSMPQARAWVRSHATSTRAEHRRRTAAPSGGRRPCARSSGARLSESRVRAPRLRAAGTRVRIPAASMAFHGRKSYGFGRVVSEADVDGANAGLAGIGGQMYRNGRHDPAYTVHTGLGAGGRDGSAYPDLADQDPEDGVALVVPHSFGDEVDRLRGEDRNDDRLIDELPFEPGPGRVRSLGIASL
jgi:hypothetical protein